MLLLNFKDILVQPSGSDISSIVSLYEVGKKSYPDHILSE